jgi:hypothetical protein
MDLVTELDQAAAAADTLPDCPRIENDDSLERLNGIHIDTVRTFSSINKIIRCSLRVEIDWPWTPSPPL